MKRLIWVGILWVSGAGLSQALAQAEQGGLVSFGRRTPTVAEVAQAFGAAPDAAALAADATLRTRGVAFGGGATAAGARLKALDMDVQFGFGSDTLSNRAKAQLLPLGEYLRTADLSGRVIVIEGHTDSLGSVDFANELSSRRAQALREFLVAEYKLDPAAVVAIGRGKQMPKDKANPASEANRRMQFYLRPKG